ncbi:MAG: putative peptidoglycan glycosyltransferase FtsW [Minisyncoccia bacterium]
MEREKVDKFFLGIFVALLALGVLAFFSASMGIYSSDPNKFTRLAFSQIFFGLISGTIACFITSKINYKYWRKYALPIFILSVIFACLVFIPGIGQSINGARRWIDIFGFSIQPIEFFKIGILIFWATWLSFVKDKISSIKYGLLPFVVLTAIVGTIALLQPDTDGFILIIGTAFLMYVIAGIKIKDFIILLFLGMIFIAGFIYTKPYLRDRISTFLHPKENSQTTGYQVQQSLIAIGSGQITGRGFGQSIQKFKYLPESISDSIFAVYAEEFGFIGTFILILLFILFAFRGLKISLNSKDYFSGLLSFGIVILIISQSFVNIGSMTGIIPLSGLPLTFFSHGSSAMIASMIMVGIVLNISKFKKRIN